MRLSSMRFKGFVWPHNPTVYSVSFARDMAVHKIPFGRYHLQGLGMTRRVMKGEGEFVGEGAYRQIKALGSVFYENTPGTLVHPLWDTTTAWFVSLELTQEPREDYVKYRFEFWEDCPWYKTGVETIASPTVARPAAQEETQGAASAPVQSTVPDNWTYWSAMSTMSAAPAAQAVNQPAYHTVTKGQTMWGLAQRYGVSLNELIALNPQIKNPNLIYAGQKVRVS